MSDSTIHGEDGATATRSVTVRSRYATVEGAVSESLLALIAFRPIYVFPEPTPSREPLTGFQPIWNGGDELLQRWLETRPNLDEAWIWFPDGAVHLVAVRQGASVAAFRDSHPDPDEPGWFASLPSRSHSRDFPECIVREEQFQTLTDWKRYRGGSQPSPPVLPSLSVIQYWHRRELLFQTAKEAAAHE